MSSRTGEDFDRVWSQFLTKVSTMVTNQTLETWFKPMLLSSIQDETVTIECPNKFFMDWVDEHHKDKILYIFTGLLGFEPENILFTDEGIPWIILNPGSDAMPCLTNSSSSTVPPSPDFFIENSDPTM